MAEIIDIPFKALEKAAPLADEERCKYVAFGARCEKRRQEKREMCQAHQIWWGTIAAVFGAPYPEDPQSLQLFLAKILDGVMAGRIRKEQARLIESVVKMMFVNARWM